MMRDEYYNIPFVKEALNNLLAKRELTFIGKYNDGKVKPKRTIRALNVRSYHYLDDIKKNKIEFDSAHEDDGRYWFFNIYRSVARYKKIPEFTYNPALRSEATKKWYGSPKCYDSIIGYDLFIDFDIAKEDIHKDVAWDNCINTLLKLKDKWLDRYKVKYQIFFSGTKGFHVLIPFEALPSRFNFKWYQNPAKTYFWFNKRIVELIKKKFDDKKYNEGKGFIDLNGNGIYNKLMKLPLSISETNKIVLPLTDNDLRNFKVNDMDLVNVWKYKNIRKFKPNNYFMRFNDINQTKARANFTKFVRALGYRGD